MTEIRIGPDEWDDALALTDGPQLVVAGPGTGKTEFLIRRVGHLIGSGVARRPEVVVLTFSRRAAGDISKRLEAMLGHSGAPIEVSTFHSLALRVLEAAGSRAVPLTGPEQVGLIAGLLTRERPEDWPLPYRPVLGSPYFAAEVADFLTRCSERLLSPGDLEDLARSRQDWRGIPGLFARYRRHLDEIGRTDYGTMLVQAVSLLGEEEGRRLVSGYRYLVIDEYQDTSPAHAVFADLLSAATGNLVVAGDPYQSIYSFRGAEVGNIAAFAASHPQAVRIVLEKSLRVPAEILDSALRVVAPGFLPGAAGVVHPADHPGRVEAYVFDQETAEAEWIAAEIERSLVETELTPDGVAVLVRSKRELLSELSRALDRRRIPHDPPDSRLVDHPAVRLVHDLVTVAAADARPETPHLAHEADRAMRRILLGPAVSLTLGQERALLRERRRQRAPWHRIVAGLPDPGLARLLADPTWATEMTAADGFWEVWQGLTGFRAIVESPDRSDWRRALASLAQVLTRQAERDPAVTLARFFTLTDEEGFEASPLISPRPPGGKVTLTTIHQAKGLEFDLVFVANAVEGVFPDLRRGRRMLRPELLSPERSADLPSQHLFQIQEEMRLAYTAITRARRRVVWTATDAGVDQGQRRPSRFLVAAAGVTGLDRLGPPRPVDRAPVTLSEAETALRRALLDPAVAAPLRLAAARLLANPPLPAWDPLRFPGVAAAGADSPILGERLTLSPSQAKAYETCPRQYALERRLRMGDVDSPYARFGSLVHTVLERAESSAVSRGDTHATLEEALARLDEVWVEADFGTPELNDAWHRHAAEAITALYTSWPSTGAVPVVLEHPVEDVIAGVRWVGKVDRVERAENGLRVVDYKTSKSMLPVGEAAKSLQLAFYTHAVSRSMQEPVVAAEMWYPRAGVGRRSLEVGALEELMAELERITTAIRAEEWAPRVGEGCRRCNFRSSCPAWPEGRGAYLP